MGSFLSQFRPSWREAFLLVFSFGAVSALLLAVLLVRPRSTSENVVAEWFQLAERCRVSIESGEPLDTRNLLPTTLSNLPDLSGTASDRFRAWAPISGRFAIREGENGPMERSWRFCRVELRNDRLPLQRSEIAAIYLAFLDQRTQLLIDGDHEPWDPTPLYKLVSLGFRPLEESPAGCRVLTALFSDMSGIFDSVSAEQTTGNCGGPGTIQAGFSR